MAAFVPASQPLFAGDEVISPIWPVLDLHENISAHELDDCFGQVTLAAFDGPIAEPQLSGNRGASFPFD
jgi:hypothetical protein